jgi:hypothetical protein
MVSIDVEATMNGRLGFDCAAITLYSFLECAVCNCILMRKFSTGVITNEFNDPVMNFNYQNGSTPLA